MQYFSPVPPGQLLDYLERKKDEFSQKSILVANYLAHFEAIQNPTSQLPKVYFFEGQNGIKQIYQDILKKEHKTTYSALSLDNIAPELKSWLKKIFTSRKIKKNIHSKVLVSSKKPESYRKLDQKHLRESLVIPHKKFPFEVEISVYDDNKTAFISFDQSEMIGVIIESSKIANTMKSLFALIWEKKK